MGTMTLNVRVSGALSDHVANNVGDDGLFENVSEYVRDLIRRDHARVQDERLHVLKAELKAAFAVPDSECSPFDADAFRAKMRARHGQ